MEQGATRLNEPATSATPRAREDITAASSRQTLLVYSHVASRRRWAHVVTNRRRSLSSRVPPLPPLVAEL